MQTKSIALESTMYNSPVKLVKNLFKKLGSSCYGPKCTSLLQITVELWRCNSSQTTQNQIGEKTVTFSPKVVYEKCYL